ncbi:styrene monooxygenase/indole monooxygenase family protein [Myxococcus sp. RHSTA-1-4]|uniref:styrene monooxygenase/indole monooxygenase family protein n=1 Tax=Myxococcus sp. RHSTA-1-4 TaxID=2874601 RepID=UPI001CBF3275|nr:styrene monooxygenase/indole monooxygenase family protein [Myxococcus sp. RHSTA-1-4]MBZ4416590.1 monooxygenase [Myxococcus sp. RHSTA-1-4]
MASIGIVGAGTSGLHLGLKLLSHGVPVTVYAEQDPEKLRAGRLPNTVAHHSPTRARERELDVDHWGGPHADIQYMGIHVNGPQSLSMRGRLEKPSIFVDYRLYQPKLAEDFVARGGRLEVLPVDGAVLEGLSLKHALVVVATGRNGLTSLFPRIPELSPHTKPARLLFAALLKGVQMQDPLGMNAHLVPGQGEIFEAQIVSRQGRVPSILIEALPGSDMAVLGTRRYDEDPRAYEALLLDALRRFAPATYERVNPAEFGVLSPMDWLQGAFTPVVRRAWAPLSNGRFVMAVGDTHVTNDPVAGQGANAASASAFALAARILDALGRERPFDEAFCRAAEEKMWAAVAPATNWTNTLLQPPPPHVVDVLAAGSQEQRVADGIANAFMLPENILSAFASPESAAAFIAQQRSPAREPLPPEALAWHPLPGEAVAPMARVR